MVHLLNSIMSYPVNDFIKILSITVQLKREITVLGV